MTRKFCPQCGKTTDKLHGSRGLCSQCYTDEKDLVEIPGKISVERCSSCGRFKIKHEWRDLSMEELVFAALKKYLENGVEFDIAYHPVKNDIALDITVSTDLDGETISQEKHAKITFETVQCKTCSRFYSGYFTVVFQLRGDQAEDVLEGVLEHGQNLTWENRKHFVSKVEKVKNGFDLYLSTREISKHLLNYLEQRYNTEVKRSKKLYGVVNDREVYRDTVLCRLLDDK